MGGLNKCMDQILELLNVVKFSLVGEVKIFKDLNNL